MPLDAAVAPKSLTSTLHYLERSAERPARYRIEPPPGVPKWNGIDDPREVRIEDARGREAEFTLDRNGFALLKAPTAVTAITWVLRLPSSPVEQALPTWPPDPPVPECSPGRWECRLPSRAAADP